MISLCAGIGISPEDVQGSHEASRHHPSASIIILRIFHFPYTLLYIALLSHPPFHTFRVVDMPRHILYLHLAQREVGRII